MKPKFEVDKIRCSARNGKFELAIYRRSSQTCKVVDASTCHPYEGKEKPKEKNVNCD